MDTSYFIKAFSASPAAVVPGYTIGGIAYFAIPWALGTIMSSVALGLENQPDFPTYPRVSECVRWTSPTRDIVLIQNSRE
jgi:hypothetical protein